MNKNNFDKLISPHDVSIELAREYGYLLDYFSKIENKKKLVIKNNNHHLRINTMAKLLTIFHTTSKVIRLNLFTMNFLVGKKT